MDLNLYKAVSKFPFVFEEIFYDSLELPQNKTCIGKCKSKDCLNMISYSENLSEYICSMGYNNSLIIINGLKFITNGLIYTDNLIIPEGRKESRKEWIINKKHIQKFYDKLQNIEIHLNNKINETIEQNFSMFHDFKTSMSIFFSCTQDIISKLPGEYFEDKLKNSDKSYQDLYNSLELITSQLGMIDVIINPKSIMFGNKKQINIYRLFEKIKILFGHLADKKRNINIKIISENWIKDSYCFDSIEFIPLILLDNALKYSANNSTIEIKFEQSHSSAKVIVKNIGPFVSEENKDRIFEKFFRDESGKSFSKEGIGMGLWIAQEVLYAHESKLSYHKDANEKRPIGLNIFSFDLQTI